MESIGINTTINSNNDATISNNSANIDSTNNGPQANIINNDHVKITGYEKYSNRILK